MDFFPCFFMVPFRLVFGKVERRLGCRTSRFLISFPACKEWKEHKYNIRFSFFGTSVELKIQVFWDVRCIGWFEVPYFFYLQSHLSKQTSVTLPVERTKHARRPVCSNTARLENIPASSGSYNVSCYAGQSVLVDRPSHTQSNICFGKITSAALRVGRQKALLWARHNSRKREWS